MKNKINQTIAQLLRDKNGNYCMRELATAIFVLVITISWIAQQFFQLVVPEYMFCSFVSLIGAGCFGYSIERKTNVESKNEEK